MSKHGIKFPVPLYKSPKAQLNLAKEQPVQNSCKMKCHPLGLLRLSLTRPILRRSKILGSLSKLLMTLSLFISTSAFAAKILIVTDQSSASKAKSVRNTILETAPFSRMSELEVVIRVVPAEKVICRNPLNEVKATDVPESCRQVMAQQNQKSQEERNKLGRLITCDAGQLSLDLEKQENADRMIFIKDTEYVASSGGKSITLTVGSHNNTAIHELLHSFGFGDEYEYYSACEADTYCVHNWANLAIIEQQSSFANDEDAKKSLAAKIPWFSKILPTTPITNDSMLGTPDKNQVGLFRTHTCDKASKPVLTWKPSSRKTVMEDLSTNYIPEAYWPKIIEGLYTKFGRPTTP